MRHREAAWRQRSRQIAIPGTVLFGRYSSWMGSKTEGMRHSRWAAISERLERTAQGYRRFRCRDCGKQFNERTGGSLNRTQYPSAVIAARCLLATALQAER
jgi:hypothetical protein